MPEPGIISTIVEYYEGKLAAFGPTARGVDWKDEVSQRKRFEQLLRALSPLPGRFSILDFGCGYGALFSFLREAGISCDYVGYDPSKRMIETARARHPDATFTTDGQALTMADYVVASGVFNVRLGVSVAAWLEYVHSTLAAMDAKAACGWAANFLTTHADAERMRSDLYYADPAAMLDWCHRRASRWVSLLHDYDLYEFTMGVRRQPL